MIENGYEHEAKPVRSPVLDGVKPEVVLSTKLGYTSGDSDIAILEYSSAGGRIAGAWESRVL